MIDAEMYGMMPRPKMQRLAEVAAGEQRDEAEHLAEAPLWHLGHLLGHLPWSIIGSGMK